MKITTSCKLAIQDCLSNKYFAIAHLYNEEKVMDMHIHDCYEIYYSISGGRQFLIDNRFYDIQAGDLFIINQFESHYLSKIDQMIHERIVISLHPELIRSLSTANTNLDQCFTSRKDGFSHRITLNPEQQKRFLYFINKISSAKGYGSDTIERAALMELLVLINLNIIQNETVTTIDSTYQYNHQVEQILSYINKNIRETISIDLLAETFYLSPSYICRIFKNATGTTINKYINARRITIAKSLLSTGANVNDVCEKCGYHDYSNFLKSFTKVVGLSPKKYAQLSVQY